MKDCSSEFPNGYVGVIDSGVGGLTVLKKLQELYPTCNFVYLADSAYCPYGTKSFDEIYNRVSNLVEFLQSRGASAVVLACNTASIFVDGLRAKFSIPIYDVIAPTCKLVANSTRTKRVALLATNATVKSGAYSKYLSEYGITVVSFPCSSFVPFVEQNTVDTPECDEAIQVALRDLPHSNVDTVILGCTHFPVLKNKIAPYANGAKIIECCTDFSPTNCIHQHPQKTQFFTTGVRKTVKWGEKTRDFVTQLFGKVHFQRIDV